MSQPIQPIRGMHDLIDEQAKQFQSIISEARNICERYCFFEVITPVMEFIHVFKRTLGDTSDVIAKEMYTLTDRGGDELALRPEGTAPLVRAFISNGHTQNLPFKAFYAGPMFRYERPQKGRLRQFNQIGVEFLGSNAPQADIETIALAHHISKALKIDKKLSLELGTLGDTESRQTYRERLVRYFVDHKQKLSKESLARLEKNPLRILDSKETEDQTLIENAPLILDDLNSASKEHFLRVQEGLNALEIPFHINPKIVRGLDYYCHTTFEFVTKDLGAQSAVIAGGRYNGLVNQMGGGDIPGVGWGCGIERVMLLQDTLPETIRPIAIIPFCEAAELTAITLANKLRHAGHVILNDYSGNSGKRMKRANKMLAKTALLLGEDELREKSVTVKNLDTGEQLKVPLEAIEKHL